MLEWFLFKSSPLFSPLPLPPSLTHTSPPKRGRHTPILTLSKSMSGPELMQRNTTSGCHYDLVAILGSTWAQMIRDAPKVRFRTLGTRNVIIWTRILRRKSFQITQMSFGQNWSEWKKNCVSRKTVFVVSLFVTSKHIWTIVALK